MRDQKELLAQAECKIPQLKQQITREQDEIKIARLELVNTTQELAQREKEIACLRELKRPTDRDHNELREFVDTLKQSQTELLQRVAILDSILKNYERIRTDGVCPTCGREADATHCAKKIAAEESRRDNVQQQINVTEKSLTEANALLSALEAYDRSQDKLALLEEPADMLRQKLSSNEEKIRTAEREIIALDSSLAEARDEV